MAQAQGMLSLKQLQKHAAKQEIDTVLLVFTDLYGRFMGKHVEVEFFLDMVEQGIGACNYLLTVDMEMQPIAGYEYSSWQTGYGDLRLAADLNTLRVISWHEKTALVICDVTHEHNHKLIDIAPRSLLQKQLTLADNMDFTAKGASELEYYIFADNYQQANNKDYNHLTPSGRYIKDYDMLQTSGEEALNTAVRRHLKQSGIPTENSKGEWGIGQHELNVRYTDVLDMADRHGIFKQCLKEVAAQMGLSVTFMAKFSSEQAGSSCHIHLSLWRKNQNAFSGKTSLGPVTCSNEFKWFLGGWLAHVPEFMVFYAPTVNSYKRYQAGSWAPTKLAWSQDNRTAGFRIVGHKESLRIECRIPGADINPYLAFTAALASGLDGIVNQIEPSEHFSGDAYAAEQLPNVPSNLAQATELFSQSDFVKQCLGKNVVEHYTHFFNTEQTLYEQAVTDWERLRYFERI